MWLVRGGRLGSRRLIQRAHADRRARRRVEVGIAQGEEPAPGGRGVGASDQVALCGQIVKRRPVLDQVSASCSGKRGEVHHVQATVEHDKDSLRVPQVAGDGIPHRAPKVGAECQAGAFAHPGLGGVARERPRDLRGITGDQRVDGWGQSERHESEARGTGVQHECHVPCGSSALRGARRVIFGRTDLESRGSLEAGVGDNSGGGGESASHFGQANRPSRGLAQTCRHVLGQPGLDLAALLAGLPQQPEFPRAGPGRDAAHREVGEAVAHRHQARLQLGHGGIGIPAQEAGAARRLVERHRPRTNHLVVGLAPRRRVSPDGKVEDEREPAGSHDKETQRPIFREPSQVLLRDLATQPLRGERRGQRGPTITHSVGNVRQ